MQIDDLKAIIKENGIIGCGGAGFPSYAKLDKRAVVVILNCAECEPLLKLHRQLLQYKSKEILEALNFICEILEADAIIGIKSEYKATIDALNEYLPLFEKIKICLLNNSYPMGDEVVLVYETTKKVIRPGGLPIEQGVIVYNVETMYNIYRAIKKSSPVTQKKVTVVAEVTHPVTLTVPIGTKIEEVVKKAGDITCKDPIYLAGGPMMGKVMPSTASVSKTTNAILVLDKNHSLVMRRNINSDILLKRAASICCQCNTCTDLCPRNALGHPIDPAAFMRVASNRDFSNMNYFLDTMYCCSCGICEMYACPQDLAPRSIIDEYKKNLRANGIKGNDNLKISSVSDKRAYRKVPEKRLAARLGLLKYESAACEYDDKVLDVKKVKIFINNHIGVPANPVVEIGQKVKYEDMIAKATDALSVSYHASIDGIITDVTSQYIEIAR